MGMSGGPLRSTLDQTYRVGRTIHTVNGPVVLANESESVSASYGESLIGSGSAFVQVNNAGYTPSGGGGGGGGGGGPSVVADSVDPVALTGVGGTEDYSFALLNYAFGGPIVYGAIFYPTTFFASAAALAGAMGIDPSWVVFMSNDGTFTATPGSVLIAGGAGSPYTWDSTPIDTTLGPAITVSPGVPTVTWNGSAYEATYAEWTMSSNVYEYTMGGGGPVVDSYFFLPANESGGGSDSPTPLDWGETPPWFVGANVIVGYGESGSIAQTTSSLAAIFFNDSDPDDDTVAGSIDVVSQRVSLGSPTSDDTRYPTVVLWRRFQFTTEKHNLFSAKMGVGGGGNPNPGYRVFVGDAYEFETDAAKGTTGPFLYMERPLDGSAPVGNSSLANGVCMVQFGAVQTASDDAPTVITLGVHSAPTPNFDKSYYGALLTFDGGTDAYQGYYTSGGEVTVELGVGHDGVNPPSTVKPYTIVLGVPLMSDPALVLSCSAGGTGDRADSWLTSLPGNRTQVLLSAGVDFGGIGGGSTLPARVVIGGAFANIGEVGISGALTFVGGVTAARSIGAAPTSTLSGPVLNFFHGDGSVLADPTPVSQSDTDDFDPRPSSVFVSTIVEVGTRVLSEDLGDSYRSRIVVRAMPDLASAGVRPYGADAQPALWVLESQDGTAYYLYVTNAGKLMISTTIPEKTATPGTIVGTQS